MRTSTRSSGWATRPGRLVRASRAPTRASTCKRAAVVIGDGDRAPRCRPRDQSSSRAADDRSRGSRRRCRARCRAVRPRCGSCRGTRRRRGGAAGACSSARPTASCMRVAAARWGTWLTTATTWSWWAGVSATTSAPSTRSTDVTRVEGQIVGVSPAGVTTQIAPLEHLRVGAVEAVELAARHRMAADEPGVDDRVSVIGCLDRADVGDDAGGLGERPLHLVDHRRAPARRRT